MELIILKRDSDTWNYAWEWLRVHPYNANNIEPTVCEHLGEVWQYMGSWKNKGNIISDFRHRSHPLSGGVHVLSVAHPSYKEEDIEKSAKIK